MMLVVIFKTPAITAGLSKSFSKMFAGETQPYCLYSSCVMKTNIFVTRGKNEKLRVDYYYTKRLIIKTQYLNGVNYVFPPGSC